MVHTNRRRIGVCRPGRGRPASPTARGSIALFGDRLRQVVLGHTLSEVGETPHHEGTEPQPAQFSALDGTTYPHLARAFATGEGLDSEQRFHRTLRILLAGYAAELEAGKGGVW
ncbi:TetR/AcrR family transcriptional regulator C-terminal domain-containing protein [Kitasatospora sp. NPDC058162]|uniref:TetR/AcrR family transcriptional regulator C-terminal domain-containing protein n=1 Tax=Kitasatospora sp. NPDC058162 TaxID=3346362 RepID=UPI0036DC638E